MKILLALLFFINSCTCQKQSDTKAAQETLTRKGQSMLVIETKNGNIEIELYPDVAPKTVAQIQELVGKGFYNGLKFHRVIPGFVAQGGDPLGNGTGGSGKRIVAEFNEKKHLEGTVAMARSQDPNSADSQFYICLAPQPNLDRQYTVFGQVKTGLEAVHRIKQGDTMDKVYLK